jgi:hypothetical protein
MPAKRKSTPGNRAKKQSDVSDGSLTAKLDRRDK